MWTTANPRIYCQSQNLLPIPESTANPRIKRIIDVIYHDFNGFPVVNCTKNRWKRITDVNYFGIDRTKRWVFSICEICVISYIFVCYLLCVCLSVLSLCFWVSVKYCVISYVFFATLCVCVYVCVSVFLQQNIICHGAMWLLHNKDHSLSLTHSLRSKKTFKSISWPFYSSQFSLLT